MISVFSSDLISNIDLKNSFYDKLSPLSPQKNKKKQEHIKAKSKYTEAVSKNVGANCTIVLWINN